MFHALLNQARGHRLVKDRLRIKDATHVLADIAIPAGLQLIAQARNKLLTAAERFAAECVVGERVRIESIRTSTDSQDDEARLIARVEHLRDIVDWATKLSTPEDADSNATWETLQKAIEIAQKALNGHDDPKASRKLRSTVDPDARRGKHGEYYDGYSQFSDQTADGNIFWLLQDNQQTVTDVATFEDSNNDGSTDGKATLINYLTYNAFGQVIKALQRATRI